MAVREETRVLIVEDHDANRLLLREHVAMSGCTPVMASDGVEALREINAAAPDMMILDLGLPRLSGESVLRKVRENPELNAMAVIVISGLSERARVQRCIELGALDFIPKPFPSDALASRLRHCLTRYVSPQSGTHAFCARDYASQMVSSLDLLSLAADGARVGLFDTVLELLERFTPETRGHLERTSAYCRVLASELSRTGALSATIDNVFIEDFPRAARLHDIGKLAVPESILEKPGVLDAEEHRVMRRHVSVGGEILREIGDRFPGEPLFAVAMDVALHHHEWWDGTGYPFGLSRHEIPLVARVMAVADVYDALRSRRSYKAPFTHEQSRNIILDGSGKQFDPAVVAGFLECEREFENLFESADTAATVAPVRHLRPRSEYPDSIPYQMAAS